MKVVLPFVYDLYLAQPRRKTGTSTPTASFLEVEVPELDAASAPEVARLLGEKRPYEQFLVPIRWADGQFYARASVGGRRMVGTDLFDPRRLGERDRDQASALVDHLCPGYGVGPGVRVLENLVEELLYGEFQTMPPYREGDRTMGGMDVMEENWDTRRRDALRRTADMVVIGGEFWRRIKEPTLRLARHGNGKYDADVYFGDPDVAGGLPKFTEFFAMTDVRRLRETVEAEGLTQADTHVGIAEVFDPAPFEFDRNRNILVRVVDNLVRFYGDGIGAMEASAVRDFLALREGPARLRSELLTDVLQTAMTEAATGFLMAMPDSGTKSALLDSVGMIDPPSPASIVPRSAAP